MGPAPPRPVKSPHGSLLHSSLATGHCKQPSSALPTNGQEVLAGIINRPSPSLCPRHLGSSEVVPIHGVFLILCKLNFSVECGWGFGNFLKSQMLREKEGPSGLRVFVRESLVGS